MVRGIDLDGNTHILANVSPLTEQTVTIRGGQESTIVPYHPKLPLPRVFADNPHEHTNKKATSAHQIKFPLVPDTIQSHGSLSPRLHTSVSPLARKTGQLKATIIERHEDHIVRRDSNLQRGQWVIRNEHTTYSYMLISVQVRTCVRAGLTVTRISA